MTKAAYKRYSSPVDLARAIFDLDVKNTLNAAFSGVFFGKLKVTLEAAADGKSYTYLKKAGWAVIHLSLDMACRFAGLNPSGSAITPDLSVAKLVKAGLECFAYHEMGHLKHTDMTGENFKAIPTQYQWAVGFIHEVSNLLEDPTEEKEISHEPYYRFTRTLFRMAAKRIFLPQAKAYRDNGSVTSFLNYVLLYLRCGPKAIAGRNAIFDSLVPKGLLDKIRDAHRERNAKERCKKQIAIAIWLIDELGLKAQDVANQTNSTRPIIILVDKKPGRRAQRSTLQPQASSLPPVSVVEADEDEDGGDGGETPDADIIDLRKNKKKPNAEDDQDGGSNASGRSDEEEGEGGEADGEGQDDQSESEPESESDEKPRASRRKSKSGDDKEDGEEDFEEDSEPDDLDSNGDEGLDKDDKSEFGDGGGKGDQSEEVGGDEGEEESNSEDSDSSSSVAGTEQGKPQSKKEADFDWEVGNDDPVEIAAEEALADSYDEDLERALRLDAFKRGNELAYRAVDVFEVANPEDIASAFDQTAKNLGSLPSSLAETLKEIKAETAPYERHLLPDGEDIDIDDFIDVRASRSCSLDIFREEEPGREITDLAISMLVDCSGSMEGDGSKCAFAAAVMVALACEEADIPTEASAFSTGGILYLKQFEDDPSVYREYLGMMYHDVSHSYKKAGSTGLYLWGGTDCESALAILLNNLEKYDGKQCKLVFIVTDGDTGDPKKVGALVRGAREEGTVVVGIGIGTSEKNLRECFERCRSFSLSTLRNLPDYIAGEIQLALGTKNFQGY